VTCSLTSMQTTHVLVLILILSVCCVSASQRSAPSASKPLKRSDDKLKQVELDGKYTIQVPNYFSAGRVDDKIAAVPIYVFNAEQPHYTTIHVSVSPYSGEIPINPQTGKFVPPATGHLICELNDSANPLTLAADDGTPLTRYFTIQDDRDVYYGCAVVDNAYECSAHAQCPHPVALASRYTTRYAFTVFDKKNNSTIEFTGSNDGPSKTITKFEGDGKLLRYTIVPSLRSIR